MDDDEGKVSRCKCQGRACSAHKGECPEPAGPSGRCDACRLICACGRSGCSVHPDKDGVKVACMNFAVGGAERGSRRCGACAADDRNRNESRPCLCCHVSPGGVPCGAHDSHLGGECTGIAVPGSKDCAECTAERKANRTFCDCDHMYCHLGDEVDASLAERQRVGAPHAGRLKKLWSLPTQVCLSIRFTTAVARLTHDLFSPKKMFRCF